MKTVVIWDALDADISFFVIDRDISHLNGKYANNAEILESDEAEINLLVWDENGKQTQEMTKVFPVEAVRAGAKVIVCGFLP